VPEWLPGDTPCRPIGGGDLCKNYACIKDSLTTIACQFSSDVTCPSAPDGCAPGVCNSVTGTCDYGPYPNGTRICDGIGADIKPCCPIGQLCVPPPRGGLGCNSNYCYYPDANH
jgi:hypothetical protein